MGSRDVCCRVGKQVLVQGEDYLWRDGSGRDTARAVQAEEKERNEMMPLRSRLIYIARRPWVVKRFSGKSELAFKTQKKRNPPAKPSRRVKNS